MGVSGNYHNTGRILRSYFTAGVTDDALLKMSNVHYMPPFMVFYYHLFMMFFLQIIFQIASYKF